MFSNVLIVTQKNSCTNGRKGQRGGTIVTAKTLQEVEVKQPLQKADSVFDDALSLNTVIYYCNQSHTALFAVKREGQKTSLARCSASVSINFHM